MPFHLKAIAAQHQASEQSEKEGSGYKIAIASHGWLQVGVEMDPESHGGKVATPDRTAIEIR